MRLGLAGLALSVAAIAVFWAWLGLPEPIHQAPLKPGQKLYCVSYAPFHGSQTPLDLSTGHWQIVITATSAESAPPGTLEPAPPVPLLVPPPPPHPARATAATKEAAVGNRIPSD